MTVGLGHYLTVAAILFTPGFAVEHVKSGAALPEKVEG
jgi:hypothetical protein